MKEVGDLYCVIDCRVSDKSQLSGDSLENQEIIGKRLAAQLGVKVARVFRKPHSATTTEREDFQEILTFIVNDSRNIKFYIVKSLDRVTRLGYVEFTKLRDELAKLGVNVLDASGIIQPEKNSLEHLNVETYKAEAEVRDILTRLIGAEISLVQDGYAMRSAPDGLKNKHVIVEGKKKVIREEDLERSKFIVMMYTLLAEGKSHQEVVKRVDAMGYRTRKQNKWDRSDAEHPKLVGHTGGNFLTIKKLQKLTLQTEYAGVSYEKWTKHQPVKMRMFNGIVPIDVFNRANRGKIYIEESSEGSIQIHHNYSPWGKVKRLSNNPDFPWKCILCPYCGSELLASSSTGKSGKKYGAYHCGGWKAGKRAHEYLRIPQAEFEENISLYLNSLKCEEGFLAGLELFLIDNYHQKEKEILIESSAVSRTVSDLKAELAKKIEAFGFAESPVVRKLLEVQIEELESKVQQVESQREEIELTEKSIRAFRRYAGYIMEHPAEILTNASDMSSRQALLNLFFEEIPTYQKILNGTPKLQPIFKLSEKFKGNKVPLVTSRGIEPRFDP
jgi:site-specific DNA recombinase